VLATDKKSWLSDSLFILFFIGIFYFIWLGNHALFVPDEGRYSEVAREMIAGNDFVTPRINGVAFLDKPVLYYWLQASGIYFFGLNEWALRFWPAIFGIFGCLITYLTGRQLFNRRTGILAAILLATSPIYYGAAHYANLDLEVAVLISATLMSILLGLHVASNKIRSILFYSAWVFCSLAFLTKGLIGLVFPIAITGCWIVLTWRWNTLKKIHLIFGPIVFLLIVFPWYYLVQKANPEFLHFFFVTQQFSRFLSHADFNNRVPTWFYLPIIFLGFLPWTIFSLQAFGQQIKNVVLNFKQQTSMLFLLIWFFVVLLFFSIPKSKTIGYIIPTLPPLALITAKYLNDIWQKNSRVVLASFVLLAGICWIGLPILTNIEWHNRLPIAPWLLAVTGLFLIASLIFLWCLIRKKPVLQPIYILMIASVIFSLLFSASAQQINPNSTKQIALELKQTLKPTDEIVVYYSFYQDLLLYLERGVTVVADWNSPDIAERDNWVRELWYGMPFQDTHKWLIDEKTFWQKWHDHSHKLVVIMDKKRFADFSSKAGSISNFKEYNDVIRLTN